MTVRDAPAPVVVVGFKVGTEARNAAANDKMIPKAVLQVQFVTQQSTFQGILDLDKKGFRQVMNRPVRIDRVTNL